MSEIVTEIVTLLNQAGSLAGIWSEQAVYAHTIS